MARSAVARGNPKQEPVCRLYQIAGFGGILRRIVRDANDAIRFVQ